MSVNIAETFELLFDKNNSVAYKALQELQKESEKTDCIYPYMDRLSDMLDSDNSYIRTRGLTLLAYNAKWDKDYKIDEIIDKLGLHVCNETVRKAVIKLGYSYKKKSLHASEQERPRCQGKTQKLEKTYVGERHKSSGLSGRKRSKHQYDATLCQSMEKSESSR